MGRQKSVKMNLSRMDYAALHTEVRRTPTKAERHEIWTRLSKRLMREMGAIGPKTPIVWTWTLGDQSGTVSAHTRSEARSAIKKVLGKRLPANLEITT
jgi:hypothetical protein